MDKQAPRPPRLAEVFLNWFCSAEVVETLLGDLYELHKKRTISIGKRKADFYFFMEVVDLCRPFAWKNKTFFYSNYRAMLKHNIKIASRQFLKHKVFTLINIFGLTLGFSSFLLILLFVNHEYSFDQFHKNKADIYRINFSFQ